MDLNVDKPVRRREIKVGGLKEDGSELKTKTTLAKNLMINDQVKKIAIHTMLQTTRYPTKKPGGIFTTVAEKG